MRPPAFLQEQAQAGPQHANSRVAVYHRWKSCCAHKVHQTRLTPSLPPHEHVNENECHKVEREAVRSVSPHTGLCCCKNATCHQIHSYESNNLSYRSTARCVPSRGRSTEVMGRAGLDSWPNFPPLYTLRQRCTSSDAEPLADTCQLKRQAHKVADCAEASAAPRSVCVHDCGVCEQSA